jgi:hypothetical protein
VDSPRTGGIVRPARHPADWRPKWAQITPFHDLDQDFHILIAFRDKSRAI